MGRLHYKGYTGSVKYDEEGNYFYGEVLGLHRDGIIYEGDSAGDLKKDFEESIDEYLSHCSEIGKEPEKPYSGKTIIRITSLLHEQAAAKAHEMGISLNEFITRAIAAAI
ncbi:MAG: type II toxin-antitoxin system HicB family antitoxin [Bacteroidales bacterium]|nr:type II toxin-antitoxin system HicB family antitoxin [Bacteroidales bacterium]